MPTQDPPKAIAPTLNAEILRLYREWQQAIRIERWLMQRASDRLADSILRPARSASSTLLGRPSRCSCARMLRSIRSSFASRTASSLQPRKASMCAFARSAMLSKRKSTAGTSPGCMVAPKPFCACRR